MKNPNRQGAYKVFQENNYLALILNIEILFTEDAPVRVISTQHEELDYRILYAACSSKGRTSVTGRDMKK